MEYGINIEFLTKEIPLSTTAKLVSEAGFTKLDYTPNLRNDRWEAETREAMSVFDAYGLTVHQTHAPFNRYGHFGNKFNVCLERCAEATAMMKAKFMVAHGDEFDFSATGFSPEAALEYNRKIYLPYVESAKKCGYKVAFETVFEDMDRRRYTSNADELLALINSFESENAVCCWDFGHANISFKSKAPEVIRSFGSLIQCTHLHDNCGIDSHQIPLTGNINWTATAKAFNDIAYSNVMSVEYAHGSIPKDLAENFLKLSFRASKYIFK